MTPDDSFEQLLARMRDRDAEAARQVFERFFARVVGLARARLDRRLAAKLDAESVANSVMATFFRRSEGGEYAVSEWSEMWSLLATITVRKCLNRARKFRNQGRDAGREIALEDVYLLDREPSPEEATLIQDLYENALRSFSTAERDVIERSLQQQEVQEIVAATGLSERTVVRIRQRFRRRLEEAIGEDAEG
jgi:DNA-directed RNA polymerase specialized sigma24 family protein